MSDPREPYRWCEKCQGYHWERLVDSTPFAEECRGQLFSISELIILKGVVVMPGKHAPEFIKLYQIELARARTSGRMSGREVSAE